MSRDSGVVGLGLVGISAALGLVGDLLFNGRPLGLNVVLFALGFVAALALLLRISRAPLHQGRRWMAAPCSYSPRRFSGTPRHSSRLRT